MGALLRSELFRLRRRPMTWVLLIILAALVVLLYVLLWTVVRTQGADDQDIVDLKDSLRIGRVWETGLGLVQTVGTILVVILAASSIGTEFGWGTIRTLLPRASSRTAFVTAKVAALVLFVVAVVGFGFLVALGASAVVSTLEDLDRGFGASAFHAVASLVRTGYVMLPYLALSFLVALWGRSSAAGIGVGLAVLFLEGLILSLIATAGGVFERVPGALLNDNVQALLSANATTDTLADASDLPGVWQATGVLALYTVAFLALAYWRFRKRDILVG